MNRTEIMDHATRFIAHRRAKTGAASRHPTYYFKGEMLTAAEIAKRTGLNKATILRRAKAGRPLDHPDKRRMSDEQRMRRGLGPRFPETGW
ncbi:hypothetical protein [Pinisolibacter sp.]|uniref:hypothetical protein n=1 Tax=Pinisolibacter sp. TaxID=2172024 RepID=UPI002FDE87FB